MFSSDGVAFRVVSCGSLRLDADVLLIVAVAPFLLVPVLVVLFVVLAVCLCFVVVDVNNGCNRNVSIDGNDSDKIHSETYTERKHGMDKGRKCEAMGAESPSNVSRKMCV